jgi:hypothetical protein
MDFKTQTLTTLAEPGELMNNLLAKALLLVMLPLVMALSSFSYVQADQSKTVSVVLEGIKSKQVTIPQGYRPHLAKLQLGGLDKDEFTVTVAVGKEQTNLAWPASPSRSLPLPLHNWKEGSTVPVSVSAPPVYPFLLNVEIICLKITKPRGY